MRPAFASIRQAAAFASLLLALLLSPLIVGKGLLPPREQIYSSIWWANGAFPYIDQEIFREKGGIDIAFIGPSHIWNAIDTRHVQEQLSAQLGRPAVVRTIGWGGAGYDALYFITRDLLQNRKVHMLVFYDAYYDLNCPNPQATRWFRWGDDADALKGLPLQLKASYYYASIIGMPRTLLDLIRANIPIDLSSSKENYWSRRCHADDFVQSLGALVCRVGYTSSVDSAFGLFEEYSPPVMADSSKVSIYSPTTKEVFAFDSGAVPLWQLDFAGKFAGMVNGQGSRLVLLHIPVIAEMRSPVIQERAFWPDALQSDVTMLGVPPAKMFAGMSDDDVRKLFNNPYHLNKNGQEYFTYLITPSLLHLYDTQVSH